MYQRLNSYELPNIYCFLSCLDDLEKTVMLQRLRAEGESMTKDEMVGWYH